MKKRLLSILCILALILSFSVPFVNAEKVILDGYEYDVSELTEAQLDEYLAMKEAQAADLKGLSKEYTNDYLNDMNIEDLYERGWTSELGGDYVNKTTAVLVEKSKYQLAIDLMLYLGIMQKNGDTFDGGKELSSSDLSKIISRLNELSNGNVEVGEPSGKITAGYFSDLLTKYLNYDKLEENSAKVTIQTEIIKGLGIDFTTNITREQSAEMLANFMEQGVVELKIVDGTVAYDFEEAETFLHKLDIGYVSGVVTANEITGINSKEELKANKMYIADEEYGISDDLFNDYFARYVKAYYSFDDDDNKTIIAMGIDEKKDRYLEIETENIENMSKDSVLYSLKDSASVKKATLASQVSVIYNKKFNGYLDGIGIEKTVDNLNPNLISFILSNVDKILLFDIDDDNKYDVVIFDYYKNYRILNISQKILDFYSGETLDIEEYEKIKIFKGGQAVTSDKLAVGDVISVAVNDDIIYIYASSDKIEGELKGINENIVSIETLESEETLEIDLAFVDDCLMGREYEFYLTYWGKLIFAVSSPDSGPTYSGKRYAYMRRVFYDEESETGGIRMYVLGSAEGEWQTLSFASKVELYDGSSMPDDGNKNVVIPKLKLTPEELANHAFASTPQLIVYHVNSLSEVTRIETAMDVSKSKVVPEGVFHRNETLTTRLRTYFNGWCGGRYYVPSSCFILKVPADPSDEGKYFCDTSVNGYMPVGAEVYDADQFGFVEGLFVHKSNAEVKLSGGNVKMIADIENTLNADNEPILKITDQNGATYTVDSDLEATKEGGWGLIESQKRYNVKTAADLKVGDLIVVKNTKTEIDMFMFYMRVSDYKNEKFFAVETGGNITNGDFIFNGIRYGKVVYNPSEKVLFINYDENNPNVRITHYAQDSANGQVYLYDTKAKTITKMKKSEVMVGDICVAVADLGYISAYTYVIR